MVLNIKTSIITLVMLVFFQVSLSGANTGKILKILEKEYGVDKSEIILEELKLDKECNITTIFMVKLNDESIGYVIEASGAGRYDQFEFLICTDMLKTVEFVRIINYYSDHGGEIASKRWLDQFRGYAGVKLKYGEDVQAISGATLSATSIVNRIYEIIYQLKEADI